MDTGKSRPFALIYELLGTALITSAYNMGGHLSLIRALSYMAGYLVAVNVSGAHFNPATSLAVYMINRNKGGPGLAYLVIVMITQFIGCVFGQVLSYALIKNFDTQFSYSLYPNSPGQLGLYFYRPRGDVESSVNFSRVGAQEILQTFIFTLIFLVLRYDSMFTKVSRIVKGLSLFHVLLACYVMSLGAGACLNPAFGLAQTSYWAIMSHADVTFIDWSCVWVYTFMPFVGAILATFVFAFHNSISEKFAPPVVVKARE